MKWFRYLFSALLLLLCLPAWRLIDWAVVTIPYHGLFIFLMVSWSLVFIALPLKILVGKRALSLSVILVIGLLAYLNPLFSNQTTIHPSLSHCGRTSYTGFFYFMREYLSNAHHDDLEVRNQICWLVKMAKKSPAVISQDDFEQQMKMLKDKLLRPSNKYRASLPWIVFLYGSYFSALEKSNFPGKNLYTGKKLMNEANFWHELYSEEISSREYSFWEWPHSSYIKKEYGFIERNWNHIAFEFKLEVSR